MTQQQWSHLFVEWLPFLLVLVLWIGAVQKMYKPQQQRQQQMLQLLTEIRDRLPPASP